LPTQVVGRKLSLLEYFNDEQRVNSSIHCVLLCSRSLHEASEAGFKLARQQLTGSTTAQQRELRRQFHRHQR
jgi:hypothetical protein